MLNEMGEDEKEAWFKSRAELFPKWARDACAGKPEGFKEGDSWDDYVDMQAAYFDTNTGFNGFDVCRRYKKIKVCAQQGLALEGTTGGLCSSHFLSIYYYHICLLSRDTNILLAIFVVCAAILR